MTTATTDTMDEDEVDAPVAPAPRRVPIGEQIEEVGRAARSLIHYPGRMKPETVVAKVERLRAAQASLSVIADNAEGLRILITVLRRSLAQYGGVVPETGEVWTPSGMERDALLASEPVRAVLDKFPDAVLAGIAPTAAMTGDAPVTSDGEPVGDAETSP